MNYFSHKTEEASRRGPERKLIDVNDLVNSVRRERTKRTKMKEGKEWNKNKYKIKRNFRDYSFRLIK